MNKKFLPKALDKDVNGRICIDVQSGIFSSDMHWHDCFEIIHISDGEAEVILDGFSYFLRSGDSIFVPRECIHRCICDFVGARRVVIGIEGDFVFGCDFENVKSFLPRFEPKNYGKLVFRGEEHPEIPKMMNAVSEFTSEKSLSSRLMLESMALRIFSVMCCEWEKSGVVCDGGIENEMFRKIEDFIKENSTKEISAHDAARYVNISYSYMAKLFSRYSSQSFSQLLCAERIDNAKKKLISTEKSVTEIGEECGFSDTSYFIAVFKRRTGVTPKLYRSKNA